MRSFTTVAWMVVVLAGDVKGAVMQATPTITPGPDVGSVEAFMKRDDPDAVSLAKILLTAIPESLRAIAATNLPAVSSILWEEFLDDKKPDWFKDLPADVQSYLIRNFGPNTAWPTAAPTETDSNSNSAVTTDASSAQTSEVSSGTAIVTSMVTVSIGSVGIPIALPTNSSTPASSPTSDPTSNPSKSGLSRNQKIGVGLGVPLALLAVGAFLLAFCFLCRRHRRRSVNGSQPPSSPGFIPRFAFQEKGEHHTPLNGNSGGKHMSQETAYSNYSNWDDDVIEPMENTQRSNGDMNIKQAPIPAPLLYHTHSSNRARGKRTSYSSLHSVAEVREPDESPVLPRDGFRPSPPRRTSFGLIPGPAQTKRKPVPSAHSITPPRPSINSNRDRHGLAAAAAMASASHTQSRPVPDHNNSSSTDSTNSSLSPGFGNYTHVTASPVSPISDTPKRSENPFSNDYYVEDYGPEYANVFQYDDLENGLYGGHTDLSRYPEPPAKNASRTEWPLRNATGHRRNKSPLWDRVYEA